MIKLYFVFKLWNNKTNIYDQLDNSILCSNIECLRFVQLQQNDDQSLFWMLNSASE